MVRVVRTLGMVGLIACSLYGQSPAPRPTFEVASIKIKAPSEAGPADFVPRRSGDRVSMHNTQLELLVPYAYHVQRGYPVEGDLNAPESWRWFDIDAIAAGSPTDDEIRLMFQSLLEERFKLKVHHETRQRYIYTLVQGKKEPSLREWQAVQSHSASGEGWFQRTLSATFQVGRIRITSWAGRRRWLGSPPICR